MKAKFVLLTRIEQRFEIIKIKKGEPIMPEGAGSFYARYSENGKRIYKPLGKDLATAWAGIKNLERGALFTKAGLDVPQEIVSGESNLALRIETYLDEIKANKARKTWLAYSNSLTIFTASCKRKSVQSVNREDMLAFKVSMAGSHSPRSIYNNFLNVMVFLKWAMVPTGVRKNDWPPKPEREPEEYTDEQINAMLTAADGEERLILNSFLCTGLRSGELSHLTYGDIDFKHSNWTVRPKADWNTKTEESQRDVPVPSWLTKRIEHRMEVTSAKRETLIFPNLKGGPDLHLLRIVKRVAKRAKIEGRVDDHKFRSTAITRWLNEGHSVPTVMRWVGHVDPATLLRYAAKANLRDAKVHKEATAPFEQFSGVGD